MAPILPIQPNSPENPINQRPGQINPPSGNLATVGNNPGLITSTGGLLGLNEVVATPAFNPVTGRCFILVHDSNNFDCEEDAEYDFRQEANYGEIPGEGREGSINLIILKYRELGKAKFNINITVFKRTIDDFETVVIPVSIPVIPFSSPSRMLSFPDGRIHTLFLHPPNGVINGERPQASATRNGNSGPMCITKLIMCGSADELPEM